MQDIFLRVHVACASLTGVLVLCLVIPRLGSTVTLAIDYRSVESQISNLFLSSNANHRIGLPHTPIICFHLMLISLSATVVFVLFSFFFLSFASMRFIVVHHFVLSVSIQLVCLESISPH
ncbi:hypothetical protein DEU56DRAFT_449351 [Suillus clintonianus]|uniref:uncharacterized protein n=1 Tax=Suillus clintonianus TaxID=1904413 RepID=UPI001B881C76|nr:uncharacterized protein DEU56DRAFT_449351 [Suillus clintonianus]KAG2132105.1 hypothetical protein DEU56DRAFT_449351 [Suillus clintonianus]